MPPTKLYGPDGVSELKTKVEAVAPDQFNVSLNFSLQTGRGQVVFDFPDGKRLVMHPNDAKLLGMRLITESEAAIGNAIALRMLLEIGKMAPAQAVQILQGIGGGTRADHAMAYEQWVASRMKAEETAEAMAKEPVGGGSN